MRIIFSILGLLLTLAVVGMLAKKQVATLPTASPAATNLSSPMPSSSSQPLPNASLQSTQQLYKDALDAALQPAKREVDDK